MLSNGHGYPVWQGTFLPFGQEYNPQITDNHYKFTGKERDSETGMDYFGARYYENGLGRFVTPDWAAKATAVPYADFPDPQSLNLYSYVRNVPTTKYDADGHCPGDDCKKVQVTVSAPEPEIIENAPINGSYKSGVGTIATVKFTDKKGNPISGVKVKENPVTKDNLSGKTTSGGNPSTATTSKEGAIPDAIIAPLRSDAEPHNFAPEDKAAMKEAATSIPYNRTTDQTLTFSTGKQECQCTYSETLSNSDSEGNLNTQNNSNGINFTFEPTTPVVQKAQPPKKDKEQK
jgi:RHS repeat-associated protein